MRPLAIGYAGLCGLERLGENLPAEHAAEAILLLAAGKHIGGARLYGQEVHEALNQVFRGRGFVHRRDHCERAVPRSSNPVTAPKAGEARARTRGCAQT